MTETTGYFCPNCLCWWTTYLNKGETLYCGCHIGKQDALWLYRKTWGNSFFGVKEKKVKIEFKGRELVFNFTSSLNKRLLKQFILWTILEAPNNEVLWQNQNYIYIAVKEGLTTASNRGQYQYRCMKCQHYKKVPGRKCELYDTKAWLTIDCDKFLLKEAIHNFLNQSRPLTTETKIDLQDTLRPLGCKIDNWNGAIHSYFTIEPRDDLKQIYI
jgi:hypothetical protein